MEDLKKMVSSPSLLPSCLPTGGFIPQLRRNCCYIVSGVIIAQNKVVLIQEAKQGCRGKWYLPAGRVERGETLIQAVQREVLEEAGLVFSPTRVVGIEGSSPGWMRINFIGNVTGGELKTFEDKESLQAKWFDIDEVINCRISLSSVSVVEDLDGRFPISIIPEWNPAGKDRYTLDILEIAQRMCKDYIGLGLSSDLKFGGVLSLAHDGRQGNDGIHFTLIYFSTRLSALGDGYTWQTSNDPHFRELVLSDRVMPLK
ncbi:hypothetical protein ACHWQZ_G002527 [Mnemiopsis leidyi]